MRRGICGSRINERRLARTIVEKMNERKRAGPAPTLEEFFPRFIEEYARANRHKPRGIESKETMFRLHIGPLLGDRPMDEVRATDVQALKLAMSEHRPKSINNVLSLLNRVLKTAVRWGVLGDAPVTVDFIRSELGEVGFYDFPQYRRLVKEARALGDIRPLAVVLLGGDAGLRRNEMIALSPSDVNLEHGWITVRFQDWRGQLISTKGDRPRVIPMTNALARVMAELVRQDNRRLLVNDAGGPTSIQTLRTWASWAQRAAGLPHLGALHVLRHTFCSHLAMRGATVLAIRELAGHKSLRTTMRYMHLSPYERARAIALLNKRMSCTRPGSSTNNQGSR